jgi:ABC-type branched-subunit amino acid transport system substrate-binding protein
MVGIALVGATLFAFIHYSLIHIPCFVGCNDPISTSTTQGIGVTMASNSQLIGLSDGKYAFDTHRADGPLKLQAAQKLQQGNVAAAESLWQQALNLPNESNDAETLIYQEDQKVLASSNPHITLVVGTLLTGVSDDIGTGRDNLQGAYVAQKEYNDGFKLKGGVLVQLLIANAGGASADVAGVAQRIVQAAKTDHTIAGVLGWPYSSYALAAIKVLGAAHIPMVSQTASADKLTQQLTNPPYFFRVNPTNQREAIIGAKYAEQQLHAIRVAIFVDPNNAYSSNLAQDFQAQFVADGNQVVATENYTVHQPTTFPTKLQDALGANPDLLYFSGYSGDMGVLLTDLGTSNPGVQVMGGDGLYQLQGYPPSARAAFSRLHFTAFAYPDEWTALGQASQKPPFFILFANDFDPAKVHTGAYDYDRPQNDVILSYDAMLALLHGCSNALAEQSAPIPPDVLQQNLAKITPDKAFQGVSGQIAFGSDGNPVDKAVVILFVNPNGYVKLPVKDAIQGCFFAGSC